MEIAETAWEYTHIHTGILKNKNKLAKKASLLNMSNFKLEENLSNV